MCVDDTCNITKKEGGLHKDQGLVCKNDKIKYPLFTSNTWYSNSCTSCTISNDELGLFDSKKVDETISGIEGQLVTASKVGKKKILFLQSNGKITERILGPVKIFSNATERLISITS